MKILYLSDLDGTLLRSDERLSDYTIKTINQFVEKGGLFSYATARSLVTSSIVTAGLNTEFPVACYNGAFVFNNKTKEILLSHYFTVEEKEMIISTLIKHKIHPIVYSFIDDIERFSFVKSEINDGMQHFLNSRANDIRWRAVENLEELYQGDVFYITCIGTDIQLASAYKALKAKDKMYLVYHKDIYSGAQWCELMPKKATKATAALELKKLLDCDRLVVFGDGLNDLPLFSVADESYAMANAAPELKEIATAVIDTNDNDGVAKWLEKKLNLLI